MIKRLPLAGLLLALVVAWFCYSAGFEATFQFDDGANLSGLAEVSDSESYWDFVLSGQAGPTGRPLSLITFALQAEQWEKGAAGFLRVNVLIHLFNAIVLAGCLWLLATRVERVREYALELSCAVAGLWVVMPLISGASLMVVQRMTTLSAMFVLLGLAGYLLARAGLQQSPKRSLVLMGTSVGLGTLLAATAKESGALLPIYILIIEATLLSAPATVHRRHWQLFKGAFLWLPLVLIGAYLLTLLPYDESIIVRRGFSASERLMSQAEILWVYLFKALAGSPGSLGVYQGLAEVSRSILSPLTLLAVLAWLVLLVGAIAWRRRYPLVAFVVLWYLGGHLVESTAVPLELYFEHRNYLPIAGVLFGVLAFLYVHTESSRRVARIVIPILFLANATFLYGFATLLTDPPVTARYWYAKYPDSDRAMMHYARMRYMEAGMRASVGAMSDFVDRNPEYGFYRIYEFEAGCELSPEEIRKADLDVVVDSVAAARFSYVTASMLSNLWSTVSARGCGEVTGTDVINLAEAVYGIDMYANDRFYGSLHNSLLALDSRSRGDLGQAVAGLQEAFELQQSTALAEQLTGTLLDAGRQQEARKFVEQLPGHAPLNPFHAIQWRRLTERLQSRIDAVD